MHLWSRKYLLVAAAVLVLGLGALLALTQTRSSAERRIDQELAKLRAAGEPTSAANLAA